MSADNFLVIDHDGVDSYLLYEGFASDEVRPFPEGLSLQGKFHTKAEVDSAVDRWSIIEYGIQLTERANLAVATEIMGEPPSEVFIAVWSGGLETPYYQAHATREIAIAKVAEAWLPDYKEGEDTIDILRLDLSTLRMERVELSPEEIATFAATILEGDDGENDDDD